MVIKGYLQTSVIEWPGKISSIIYTFGCNFRCPFCHNRDLVDPSTSLRMTRSSLIEENNILEDLVKRKKWVEAVILTGGEPTLQPDLPEFLSKIKKMGFMTMIETNGSRPETIARLLDCYIVDRVAMDIKGPMDHCYDQITNSPSTSLRLRSGRALRASKIKKSIEIILKSGIEYEFRTTVVPGIHDKKVLIEMRNQLKETCSNIKYPVSSISWKLQNFQPNNCLDPKFNKLKPFSEEEFEELRKIT